MFPSCTTINRVTITRHLQQPTIESSFNITNHLDLSDFDDDFDEVDFDEANFIIGLDPDLQDDNEVADNYFEVTIFR